MNKEEKKEILKNRFHDCKSEIKTLPKSEQKIYLEDIKNTRDYIAKYKERVSDVSKDFFYKKIDEITTSIEKKLQAKRIEDNKQVFNKEAQKISQIVKSKNLSKKETKYLVKKVGLMNNFNISDWYLYMNSEFKTILSMVGNSIENAVDNSMR
jgi:uncharacterized protein HemX